MFHGGSVHYGFQTEWLVPAFTTGGATYLFGAQSLLEARSRAMGTKTLEEFLEAAPRFSLKTMGLLDKPSAPILGVNGKLDDQAPVDDIYLLMEHGSPKSARIYPRGPPHGPHAGPAVGRYHHHDRRLAEAAIEAVASARHLCDSSIMEFPFVILILVIVYVLASIRVLRQYERGVVFLLGKFEGVRGAGLTLVFVPIQQMVRVSLRTVTMQIPSQKIITKDNVSIDIAAVAYYHISDPERAVIVIENVYNAINQISQTTVRNVVGRFSLDQLLSDTASINEQIKNVIDGHTEPWGTQVTAVEIKDITLPENMQRAMAKEAEAERERRAKIVAAEGEYQAAVKLGEAADIITRIPWRFSFARCRRWRKSRSKRTRPSSSPHNS